MPITSVAPNVIGGNGGSVYSSFQDEKIIGEYGTVLNGNYLTSLTQTRGRMIYVCQINHDNDVIFMPDLESGPKRTQIRPSLCEKEDTTDVFSIYEKQTNKWLLDRLKVIWRNKKPMKFTKEKSYTGTVRWFFNGLTCHSLTSRASVYIVAALYSTCLGVFIFLVSNTFNEHLSKLFIRQEEDSITDILGAITSLAMASSAILAFALSLFSVILLWMVTPRNCNVFGCGKTNKRDNACCGRNVRISRRKRMVFLNLIKSDVVYDPNLIALHEFDYDSDNDDPVAAVLYYHLEEAGKFSIEPKKKV